MYIAETKRASNVHVYVYVMRDPFKIILDHLLYKAFLTKSSY